MFSSRFLVSILLVVVSTLVIDCATTNNIRKDAAIEHTPTSRARRILLDNGRRIQIVDTSMRCLNEWGTSPCGPESSCEDTIDGFICMNEFVQGCIGGCESTGNSDCVADEYGIYSCKCYDGYVKDDFLRCVTV